MNTDVFLFDGRGGRFGSLAVDAAGVREESKATPAAARNRPKCERRGRIRKPEVPLITAHIRKTLSPKK